ncbi:hypothetical protein Misp01_64950 [Microtetraspora sp. NBRC 13810]|uniref:ribosome-inactivating family protein n=1 Tax=Microtetraspora sp. NBRC 13810 TaxID=3030990 RepID=UPI0024A0B159|nr:ribosome-inactivating family protein [Microtetraspora sp. NBRC 13810]GLW11367.1 hypothetical protein Misp01_64950 [Microtetraspora sp. NBRC 13810]
MVLRREDILKLYEMAAGTIAYQHTIDFLRERYKSSPQDGADGRFFRVDLVLKNRQGGKHTETVRLYFEKQNLYLRGWAIDAGRPFVAAWGSDEAHDPGALPTEVTWREEYKFVRSDYGQGQDVDGSTFSRKTLFEQVRILHDYLRAVTDGKEGKLPNAQLAFRLIARMLAEMARFDAYCQEFRKNWTQGIRQDVRPASQYEWSDGKKIPPFKEAIKDWSKYSRRAGDKSTGKPPDESFVFTYDGLNITADQAAEVLGDEGARWRES